MKLSKGSIIVLIIVGFIVVMGFMFTSQYNGLVSAEEGVNTAWAQVENVYQRRLDLIPNLVKTVEGASNYEKETLAAVVEARAAASSVKIDPNNLNEQSMAAFEKVQGKLGSSLNRLLVVVEKYPDLRANQNYLDLQVQLEGTENRIAYRREVFNEVAKSYNTQIRRFPKNIVAGLLGFEKRAYFSATEGAEKAPEVKFGE